MEGKCRLATAALAFAAAAVLCPRALAQPVPVARVAGEVRYCMTSTEREVRACAMHLLQTVRAQAEEAFIETNGLRASAAEVDALSAYNVAFEAHDRHQRSRKLEELSQRLAASTDAAERERLAEFRAVLVRLARYEADVDAGVEERVAVPVALLRRWIEAAKLNAALYARFGGTVGVMAMGPYAHGAMQSLVRRHLESGAVEFLHADVRRNFETALAAPPRIKFDGTAPDFTPYWQRPIPPSYVVD